MVRYRRGEYEAIVNDIALNHVNIYKLSTADYVFHNLKNFWVFTNEQIKQLFLKFIKIINDISDMGLVDSNIVNNALYILNTCNSKYGDLFNESKQPLNVNFDADIILKIKNSDKVDTAYTLIITHLLKTFNDSNNNLFNVIIDALSMDFIECINQIIVFNDINNTYNMFTKDYIISPGDGIMLIYCLLTSINNDLRNYSTPPTNMSNKMHGIIKKLSHEQYSSNCLSRPILYDNLIVLSTCMDLMGKSIQDQSKTWKTTIYPIVYDKSSAKLSFDLSSKPITLNLTVQNVFEEFIKLFKNYFESVGTIDDKDIGDGIII